MWLLKRGRALARAGWLDNFEGRTENPPKQPWRPWGAHTDARIEGGRLRLVDSSSWFGFGPKGGWGYEYQPLTANWGFEFRAQLETPGVFVQNWALVAFLDQNWTGNQNPDTDQYQTIFSLGRWTEGEDEDEEFVYGARIRLRNKDAINAADVAEWQTTQGSILGPATWDVRIYNDQTITVARDGVVVLCYWEDDPDYRFGPGRRAANFRSLTVDTLLDHLFVYDLRLPTSWTSLFYDDFNRPNGAAGNGWTQIGNNASIVNNSWSTTGTTDGSRALVRPTGITNGRIRIEGTVGGNIGPSNSAKSSLLLCVNNAGNQALACNLLGNKLHLGRYSSALSANLPTWTGFSSLSNPIGVNSGDAVGMTLYDGELTLDVNGQTVVTARGVHAVVPASNDRAGLRVERVFPGSNSNSWNSVRILSL